MTNTISSSSASLYAVTLQIQNGKYLLSWHRRKIVLLLNYYGLIFIQSRGSPLLSLYFGESSFKVVCGYVSTSFSHLQAPSVAQSSLISYFLIWSEAFFRSSRVTYLLAALMIFFPLLQLVRLGWLPYFFRCGISTFHSHFMSILFFIRIFERHSQTYCKHWCSEALRNYS